MWISIVPNTLLPKWCGLLGGKISENPVTYYWWDLNNGHPKIGHILITKLCVHYSISKLDHLSLKCYKLAKWMTDKMVSYSEAIWITDMVQGYTMQVRCSDPTCFEINSRFPCRGLNLSLNHRYLVDICGLNRLCYPFSVFTTGDFRAWHLIQVLLWVWFGLVLLQCILRNKYWFANVAEK